MILLLAIFWTSPYTVLVEYWQLFLRFCLFCTLKIQDVPIGADFEVVFGAMA